jgi:hypothetical protein
MRTIKADLAASLFPIRERFGFRIKVPLSEKLPSLVCRDVAGYTSDSPWSWEELPALV